MTGDDRRLSTTDATQSAHRGPAQIIGLDILRLIAAFAVVIYHFADQVSVPGSDAFRFSGGVAAYPELVFFAQHGWMGVPAFFVISGFVISLSASAATPGSFLASRVLRLVPAVWICAPITAVIIVLSGQSSVMHVLGRLFNSMAFFPFGSQIDGVYWTLSIEVSFYFTVFVLLSIGRFSLFSRYIYAIGFISAAFNISMSLGFEQINVFGRWTKFLLIAHGCEFALGAIAYRIHSSGLRAHRLLFLGIALLGTYAQTTPSLRTFEVSTPTIIWSAFLMLFAAMIVENGRLLGAMTPMALRTLREAGKATYPLYLIHQVVGAYIIYLLITLGMHRYSALLVTLGVIFLMTAMISRLEPTLRERIRPFVARLSSWRGISTAPDNDMVGAASSRIAARLPERGEDAPTRS